MEVFDAQIIPRDQLHRLPDALGDVSRTPVPSIVVGSFAGVGVGGNTLFADRLYLVHGRQAIGLGLYLRHHQGDRRMENNSQCVFADLQAIFHRTAPRAKHVVGLEQLGVVEINVGIGVEAGE